MRNLVKIVPAYREGGSGIQIVNGTKLVLSDGSELEGVVSLKITADINQPWQAEIVVMCQPPELEGVLAHISATAEYGDGR